MPSDKNCLKCGGTGHIIIDSLNAKRCTCLLQSLYAKKLGRILYHVKPDPNSFLLKKLDSNVLLVSDDDDINPHLKAGFLRLGLEANWVYVDDSNVLQAWLGKPNTANAENLNELIEYPFMVLRLGVVGYQNKALPGVICELLMGRVLGYKPTWIVSPRDINPETCLEYSDELDNLLRRYFEFNNRFKPNQKEKPRSQSTTSYETVSLTTEKELEINGSGNASITDALRRSNLWSKTK